MCVVAFFDSSMLIFGDSDWLFLLWPFTDPECEPAISDDWRTPVLIVSVVPKMDTRSTFTYIASEGFGRTRRRSASTS